MNHDMEKILKILQNYDEETQKKLLLETAATIGSTEWQQAVKDLIARMENLKR